MIILFLIIVLVVLAGLAVLWASRLPGSVLITLGPETAIELKLVVAILGVLLLGAAMAVIWVLLTEGRSFSGNLKSLALSWTTLGCL